MQFGSLRRLVAVFLAPLALAGSAMAQASLTGTFSFTSAEAGREALDVGGTWDGFAEIATGDVVSMLVSNDGNATAFDLTLSVDLPAGFSYAAGTASGLPGISATQVGQALNFTFPMDTDLAQGANETISFGLVAGNAVVGGTYGLGWNFGYGSADGLADESAMLSGNVLVRQGASVVSVSVSPSSAAVGDQVTFDATLTSTGQGALFDVVLDAAAVSPTNAGGSLTFVSIAEVSPGSAGVVTSPSITFPYLAPGDTVVVRVTADVTGCETIDAPIAVTDRTGATAATSTGSVTLDLTQPLVALTTDNVVLDFTSSVAFDGVVNNTGIGAASSLSFTTNLNSLDVVVSNLSSDWSYDSGTGIFTYVANGGVLANAAMSELDFEMAPMDACSASGGTVIWASQYENVCGDPYSTPVEVSSVGGVSGSPTLGVEISTASRRMDVGSSGSMTVTVDWSQRDLIGDDPIEVIIQLAPPLESVVPVAPAVGSISAPVGNGMVWTIPHSGIGAAGSETLTINFDAPGDPCFGGSDIESTAAIDADTVTNISGTTCPLDSSSSQFILVTNAPTGPLTQQFNVQNPGDGLWETGAFDDGDAVREESLGEGEFITYTAVYEFGAPFTGTWAGSTFKDFLAGLATQQYVVGTAMIEVDGGAAQALVVSAPDAGETGIKIDLAQVAAMASDTDLEGHDIVITYQTVVQDAFLGGAASGEFTELVELVVGSAAGDAAACNMGEYVQGAFVNVGRADARIAVSIPSQVDVCEEFDAVFSVNNGNAERAENIRVTIDTGGDYAVVSGQTPTYTGDFLSNVATYDENLVGGDPVDPTITLPAAAELTGGGTITLRMRRRAAAGTTASAAAASVSFDSVETHVAGARSYTNGGSDTPILVREAGLNLTVSPQTVTVVGTTVRWTIDVTNGGAGVAFNSLLSDTMPAGLTPNLLLTNAENGTAATASGQDIDWDLGNIAPGTSVRLVVVADVAGTACSIPAGTNDIQATWGCGTVSNQTSTSNDPNFEFESGSLQTLHDTANSSAVLCDNSGQITITVSSTGASHVTDVSVVEDLATSSSGLTYVNGTSTFTTNLNGTPTAITGAPTVTAGGEITWTSANISALADLAEGTDSTGVTTVNITFNVSATEDANLSGGAISASASGFEPCGNGVSSPASSFTTPLEQPSVVVDAMGENRTTSSGQGVLVTGVPGDTVRWTVTLDNTGDQPAENARFRATLPEVGVGGATLTLPGGGTQAITSGTWIDIADLGTGGPVIYQIEYDLGTTCVDDGDFTAEMTWGCVAAPASSAAALSSPSDTLGEAVLDMQPDFTDGGVVHTLTRLSNSRVQVAIVLDNAGAPASNLVADSVLTGFEVDTTFTPTVTGGVSLGSMTFPTASDSEPRFTLSGTLDPDETATITFQVIPTQGFDSLSDGSVEPEVDGDGDSALTANGSVSTTLSFDSDCGDSSSRNLLTTIDPDVPDLDLFVDADEVVVEDGEVYTFNFTIENTGELDSVAENILFTPSIGTGWSSVTTEIVTVGTGGTAVPGMASAICGGTCTELQLGSLDGNQRAVVRITATANDNGNPLTISGTVNGSLHTSDGAATADDYSVDVRQSAAVGFEFSQVIIATSETFTGEAKSPRPLGIGEEVTFQIEGRWFGGNAVTDIEIKDSLPTGLGFVSAADVASTMSFNTYAGATGTTLPSVGDTGVFRFVLADVGSGVGTFQANLVARALNTGTTSGSTLTNPSGAIFDTFGQTFASNNALDGLTGDVADPALHANTAVDVLRAELDVATLVRNVTAGQGTFTATTTGDAGDVLEFQTVVSNTGDAAAFDVVVTEDPTSADLLVVSGAADSIDNDGDGATDEADEGTFVTGGGGSVVFDATDNADLGQMDPTDSVTFLYRMTVGTAAEPEEVLSSAVDTAATSLDGGTGNQTASPGAAGDADGAEELAAADVASLTVDMISLSKTLVTTSEGGDTSTDVAVGEILQFRLATVLPEGTAPDFELDDALEAGLSLVATPAVTFGWAGPAQPTITPGVLPAAGAPLAINYDFGTITVPAGTDAQRTITVDYFVQVENVAANVDGASLENSATYMFGMTTSDPEVVSVSVVEPGITIATSVTDGAPIDAGATLTYEVTVTSVGNDDAHDLDLRFTLPAGTSYVASSTTDLQGPSLSEPEVSGSTVIWGRTQTSPAAQDIDLDAPGGTDVLRYSFQVTLTDAVEPDQAISGGTAVTWTSLDDATGTSLGGVTAQAAGGTLGERDGSGTVNDLSASTTSSSTVADAYANRVTASGDSLSPGGFRVGDLVTFAIEVDLQEGTTDGVVIQDTLPSGLAFFDGGTITPATGVSGFTYTQPAGANAPTAGDTGTLQWTVGTVVNAGDNVTTNDTLTLTYRARVLDTGGVGATPLTQSLSNSAQLAYLDAADGAASLTAVADAIDVRQPSLSGTLGLGSGQATTVGASDTVRYVATLANGGDGPAYNTVLSVVLPAGLRDTTPSTVSATIGGAPVTPNTSYSNVTGLATWSLTDAQVMAAGATGDFVVTFDATTDADVGAGLSLTATAEPTSWFSKESADTAERREYGPASTEGETVMTVAPTDITKVASAAGAAIGEEFTYTITVPGTATDAALHDVTILDALPSNFTLVSAATNAATLGTTLVDGSSGQNLSYTFDLIPAGAQAAVTLTVRFDNEAANQDSASVTNTARYTFAGVDGGAQSSEISATAAGFDVLEPALTIDKTFNRFVLKDAMQGLQAGDRVVYDIVVTNSGDAPAYDLVIEDLASEKLINPQVTGNPDDPGSPTTVGTTAGVTTYRWTVAGPLAPSASYAFEVSLELDVTAEPQEMIENGARMTWTSLPGASAFERTGADGEGGALDDYAASETAPVTVTVGNVVLTKLEDSAGDGTYAPGEVIEYDLAFSGGQGSIGGVILEDTLPAGLVFESVSLVATNYQRAGGGLVTLLAEPSQGDIGTLTFDVGDIESTGTRPQIEVSIRAYVDDIPAVSAGGQLTNTARLIFDDPDDPGNTTSVVAQTSPVVDIVEPALAVGFDGVAGGDLGDIVDLSVRIDNTGDGVAWQPVLVVDLPAGMRDFDPTGDVLSVAVVGGRDATLALGTDYSVVYDSVTGRLTVTLIGAQGFVDPSEVLEIDFRAQIDEAAADGATLSPVATVVDHSSVDTAGGTPDGTRTYAVAPGAGTTGAANGAMGDDETDDLTLTASVPELAVSKSVDQPLAEAGTFIAYSIVLSNTGSAETAPADLIDDLDPNIVPGTLRNVVVTPSTGTLTIEQAGGANGTGRIRIDDLVVAASSQVTISFECGIARPLPDGTEIFNQATLDVPFFAGDFLSDSTNPLDNDGVDSGNDPGSGDDDDGTRTIIGAEPVIELTKEAIDDDGAPLVGGDTITYRIVGENVGNELAVDTRLYDAIPGGAVYVPGSTVLDGTPVPDVGGVSPLAQGLIVQSPGASPGELEVDEPFVLTFQVTVSEELEAGATFANQAELTLSGLASGVQPPVSSDDPATDAQGDATRSVLSGGPVLEAVKSVEDLDGGSVAAGDELRYTITVSNLGDLPSTGVVLLDPVPAGTTFAPGTLVYDPDGAGPLPSSVLTDALDGDAASFGGAGAGEVRLDRGDLPPGEGFTLSFRVFVDGIVSDGTVIANQGVVSSNELPEEATDADGNDADGDEPTLVIVGNEPALRMRKTVEDLSGGDLDPGDTIRYRIVLENIGAADAVGIQVADPIPPAGTTYVAGSTRRDGALLADGAGPASALLGGVSVGTLVPGERVQFSVDVQVLPSEPGGSVISNQATFTSTNAGSGVSDSDADDLAEGGNDPGDPNDDDPTTIAVGGAGTSVSSVSGFVWRDYDHDRVFTPSVATLGGGRGVQPDEPMVGWRVELVRAGLVTATAVTGEDGGWSIVGATPGHGYEVRFIHPATGTVFGNPVSNHPGATTDGGVIGSLFLAPGGNVVNQNLPLDPSGVVYNSVTRQPVAGVVATIAGPAGFDPAIHLAGGQQGQVTAADGFYQFDLLVGFPAGTYAITLTPPLGYLPTFPSVIVPPTAGPLDPTGNPDPFLVVPNNGPPQGSDPTTYYVEFDLAAGDPNTVNNHIAIDPILGGSVALTKTSPKQNVVRGDLVPYTLAARNLLAVPLPPSDVIDVLPPGFKYVSGSGLVDGVPAEPQVNGRTLTWSGIDFAQGQVREIVLVTVVGAGVDEGRYVNTGRVNEPFSQELLSNVATAETFVVPDPVTDCSDVLGKVFDDRNGNGYQDLGEPGLAGVRLVTARGLVVTTDEYGRYHIACPQLPNELRGSNFILKIDERSLPQGYRPTTENPRVIRLTRGKFVEADFGACSSRELHIELSAKAFGAEGSMDEGWDEALRLLADEAKGGRARLRIGYVASDEDDTVVVERLDAAVDVFRQRWQQNGNGELSVEREVRYAPLVDVERGKVKRTLTAADVRVQADGGAVRPRLNVTAGHGSVPRSGVATFMAHANYWPWIARAELRLFGPRSAGDGEPLRVLEMRRGTVLEARIGDLGEDALVYVLRVTDAQGRFDETRPQTLRVVPDAAFEGVAKPDWKDLVAGYGENRRALANIPVRGGMVTVSGKNMPPSSGVSVGGQPLPVGESGKFAADWIVGEGTAAVDVLLTGEGGERLALQRTAHFPKDEWFYVALADLTVGGGSDAPEAALLTGDNEFEDDVYVNGRLAFYVKGKIKGEHLLTMSLDTRDRPLDEVLDGLDETDPRALMRFIDPDRFYPVYGDDSTTVWDAPTQGRFYVRLEGPGYRVLWGNFRTQLLETELAQVDRALYGFQGSWTPEEGQFLGGTTSFGEKRTQGELYAASPDSAAAREELRGTGGSLYYLRHPELVIGSERVRIEVRDKDSGIVLSVQTLAPQQDYEIDYLAGRILLSTPLPSTATDGFAVQNSSLAGNPVYLVARYEFIPRGTDLDALNVGGRVSHWIDDTVRVGLTVDHQDQTGGDRELVGADITWRRSAGTYLRGEFAATDGPGDSEFNSQDGGFNFGQAGGALGAGADGQAYRVEAAVDLGDEDLFGLAGRITGVVQRREAGFSGPGQVSAGDSTQVSVQYIEPLSDYESLRVELDLRDEDLRASTTAIDAQYDRKFADDWSLGLGVRSDDIEAGTTLGALGGARDGRRSDVAVRLGYGGFDRAQVYVYGQGTLARTGSRTSNNRYGLGGSYAVSDALTLESEVSGGNGGFGARVGSTWNVSDRTELYLAYGLDGDRSDNGLGARNGRRTGVLTAGAKHRYSDTVDVYGEERFSHGDGPTGLTHVYGVNYAPTEAWTFGALVENGRLEEAGQRAIERSGVSLNAGYGHERTKLTSAVEWREDESVNGDRITWLTRNTAAYQAHPDWRLLATLDLARSNGGQGVASNADFTELSMGWAHRPVDHERWQALLRYTYHEDLPSPGQVDAFGGFVNFAQRSHVVSADANYDLTQRLTVGGKVGVRYGELKATKGAGEWFDSRALFYALRADMHVVKSWDALLETRVLDIDAAEDRRLGVLASVWRHIGDNGKLGVGYSFADFSDDLTDLAYDHQGWFLNLVGKF